jgi:hypothetical protein
MRLLRQQFSTILKLFLDDPTMQDVGRHARSASEWG